MVCILDSMIFGSAQLISNVGDEGGDYKVWRCLRNLTLQKIWMGCSFLNKMFTSHPVRAVSILRGIRLWHRYTQSVDLIFDIVNLSSRGMFCHCSLAIFTIWSQCGWSKQYYRIVSEWMLLGWCRHVGASIRCVCLRWSELKIRSSACVRASACLCAYMFAFANVPVRVRVIIRENVCGRVSV